MDRLVTSCVVCLCVQLKLKYKKEEKLHKDIVDASLRSSTTFDYERYKEMVEKAASLVAVQEEAVGEEVDPEPAAEEEQQLQ